MKVYRVEIEDISGEVSHTICDEKDLVNLVNHIDKSRFEVRTVDVMQNYELDYKEFCVTNEGLEIGIK